MGIFSSRILGFLREVLTAYYFGAGGLTDAFFLAWKIPNIFRRVLGEGALEKVFLPLLREGFEERFVRSVLGSLLSSSLLLVLLISSLSEDIVKIVSPEREEFFLKTASEYLALLIFYLPFAVLNAYYAALLQYRGAFFLSYLSSAIFNLTVIFFILLFAKTLGVKSLIFGVLSGGFLQVLYITLLARLKGVFYLPSFEIGEKLKRFFKNLIPSFASAGIGQFSTLVEAFYATSVGLGVLSSLYYAFRLFQLPVSLIGVASSRVGLVYISRVKRGFNFGLKKYVLKSSEMALFLAIPVSVSAFVYAEEVVKLVYQRGAFSLEDTQRVALFLKLYSLGIPAVVLNSNVSNIYYATGRFYTAFFLSLSWLASEILIPFLGIYLLNFGGWVIALAHSVGAWSSFLLLSVHSKSLGIFWRAFKRVFSYFPVWVLTVLFLETLKDGSDFLTLFAVISTAVFYLYLFKKRYNF